jgi:hypothetical protein
VVKGDENFKVFINKNIDKKYVEKYIKFLNNNTNVNKSEINYKNFELLFIDNLKLKKYNLIKIFLIYIKNKIKIYNYGEILRYFLI